VLGVTPTRRAVARTPLRSAKCPITSRALSSGKHERNKGVPFRSEKRDLQVRQ
jgi:hypothetical protein